MPAGPAHFGAAVPSTTIPSAQTILQLQRSAGNRAVLEYLQRVAVGAIRPDPAPVIRRDPEIEATDDAMGQKVVDGVNAANQGATATSGVHYAHNYERYAKLYKADVPATAPYKPYADFWKEDYWSGYADPNVFERKGFMSWQLLPMESAADAIKKWLAGPTIAECMTVLVAIELDTLRAAIGDEKFDGLFSSMPRQTATKGLLKISQSKRESSLAGFMGGTFETMLGTSKTPGSRGGVAKGEWYYFYNHPMYLLKHPGGAFQGENAICMDATLGHQLWAGFGVPPVTEGQMMETMAGAYNAARTERDYRVLLETQAPTVAAKKTALKTYAQLYAEDIALIPNQYRHDRGVYPDVIAAGDVLSAPEYTIGRTTRKGGFVSGSGTALNEAAVKSERNA
jgi:hypothetical protein